MNTRGVYTPRADPPGAFSETRASNLERGSKLTLLPRVLSRKCRHECRPQCLKE